MKKMKYASFLIALIVTLGIMLTGCGGGESLIYGSWQITEAPTCTHVGMETRVCLSDPERTQSRYVPALGHDYGDWVEVTPATTSSTGLKKAYCKHDNAHFIEEIIPKLIDNGEEKETVPGFVPEPPAIPADDTGVFVLGGYSTYVSEETIYSIIKDFEVYCNENSVARKFIGWRMYNSASVADLSASIRADNNVDALLGGGANIDTNAAGNLSGLVVRKSPAGVTIYHDGSAADSTRRHVTLNSQDLTEAFWTYISLPRAVDILTAEHPYPSLVSDAPAIPADEAGVFVLGGYSTFISEEKVYAVIKDFELYCNEKTISRRFIGWRMYNSASVAALSASIRADNDVDALLGGGANIDTNAAGNLGGVVVNKSAAGVTIYHDGSAADSTRRHVTLNSQALTEEFWTYISLQRAVDILTLNCTHVYEAGVCKECGAVKPVENARVLLVGNSYTYYNDNMLAKTLKTFAADARYNITVDELSNGSAHLQYYINGQYSADFLSLISSNTYQYIVLQEHSTYPVNNKANFVKRVTDMKALISAHQSSAEIVLYMTWARRSDESWLAENSLTAKQMEDKLYEAYSEAAKAAGAKLSPVGRAFGLLRNDSSIEMYADDATHPSRAGSYLAALTLYSTIFTENALMVKYIPTGINTAASIKLREAARSAVKAG